MLGTIFGLGRVEVTEDWRKLHSMELRNLYSLPNIVSIISSRMRWVRHGGNEKFIWNFLESVKGRGFS
jgi:hypothetical protein